MKKLLVLVLLFISFSANALVTATPKVWWNTQGNLTYNTAGSFFLSPDPACKNYYDRGLSTSYVYISHRLTYPSGQDFAPNCFISVRTSSGNVTELSTNVVYALTCPTGFSISTQPGGISAQKCISQTCPAGSTLNPVTNTCDDNCLAKKGQPVEISVNGSNTNAPAAVCMPDNCAANLTGSAIGQKNGKYFGYAYGKYSGSSCTSEPNSTNYTNPVQAPTPPADSPETDCIKQGQSFGTVNGAVTCVPKGTSGAPPVADTGSTKTNTKTTDTKGETREQESTETKTTTKDGDSVTQTTTTTNPDGSKKEETKTQTFDEFCSQNPNNKLCKGEDEKESKFEGDCAANFVCEGDRVQCAIALKQHLTYCENTKANTFSDIFDNQKAAADGLQQTAGTVLPTSTVDLPTVIQGQKLLTSGGLSDISFPVAGQAIVLPLSRLNSALEFAGQMVLIISYLISAYILFGHKGAQ